MYFTFVPGAIHAEISKVSTFSINMSQTYAYDLFTCVKKNSAGF